MPTANRSGKWAKNSEAPPVALGIKVCTGYTVNGTATDRMPYDITGRIEPILEKVDGWGELHTNEALPDGLERYIALIERYVGVPITLVSLGPDRAQTVLRQGTLVH